MAKSNGCFECSCEPTINLVHCHGYHVTSWPIINNSTWIKDVVFINTLIQDLPVLNDDEYNQFRSCKIIGLSLKLTVRILSYFKEIVLMYKLLRIFHAVNLHVQQN